MGHIVGLRNTALPERTGVALSSSKEPTSWTLLSSKIHLHQRMKQHKEEFGFILFSSVTDLGSRDLILKSVQEVFASIVHQEAHWERKSRKRMSILLRV